MIELGRHIEILLLSNDCVTVPSLGGFVAHHVSAHYDEDDRMFLPPLRTLGFNSQLKHNDSLLAQSYIEAYDLSYPEAMRKIEEEVDELKQQLYSTGLYELNDIGTLYANEDGGYTFEPCEAGILSPDIYGLSSVGIEKLDTTDVRNDIYVNDEQTVTEKTEAKECNISSLHECKNTAADEGTIKIKIAWIRNAISAAAAIIAFLFVTTPVSNSTETVIESSFQPAVMLGTPAQTPKTNSAAISTSDIKKAVIESKQNTEADTEHPETANNYEDSINNGRFCIVMASHVAKSNADSFVKELHKKGYDKAYVYINNNIVRVVYGYYQTESEAQTALREIRDKQYFEQSWVYKKK